MKILGILGGMGPEASVDLYRELVQRFYTSAGGDLKGYPHIMINNVPVPNLFQQTGEAPGLYLGEQASILERSGAQVMGVACNSAHFYLKYIKDALTNCLLLDMIKEVALRVRQDHHTKVGILSSVMSRPIYAKHFKEQGIELVMPEAKEQEDVERIISEVLGGVKSEKLTKTLADHGTRLMAAGAECIILGCTDLPLILKSNQVDYPLYSSTSILADAMVREANA
ncbi:amino acid racemase [bacterium]|nr:amino acid racemase [bacterium]